MIHKLNSQGHTNFRCHQALWEETVFWKLLTLVGELEVQQQLEGHLKEAHTLQNMKIKIPTLSSGSNVQTLESLTSKAWVSL